MKSQIKFAEDKLKESFEKLKDTKTEDKKSPELQEQLYTKKMLLRYYWGISVPNSYPTKMEKLQSDSSHNMAKDKIFSEFEAIHKIAKLKFAVEFDRSYRLSGKPHHKIVDKNNNDKSQIAILTCNGRLYYKRYEIELRNVAINDNIRIHWLPAIAKENCYG